MADETPKKKKTIPLPPKKDDPAPTTAPKAETIDEKIARLEKEAKLAALEKEAAARNRPPVTTRTKEAVVGGVKKAGEVIGKGASKVAEKTGLGGAGKKISPITGRLESSPSLFEKGLTGLADVTQYLANKAKSTLVGEGSVEDKIRAQMTEEDIAKDLAKRAKRESEAKRIRELQAKEQRLSTPSQKLQTPEGQKVVVQPRRGVEGVVPVDTADTAVARPLEERLRIFKPKVENFLKKESPWLSNPDRTTVPTGALEGARNKVARMVGQGTAEDFLVTSLNRSKMFKPDEVPAIARQLIKDQNFRKMIEDSGLWTELERPNSRLSGGAPKPIQKPWEFKFKPEPVKEPTLQERLAVFRANKPKAAEVPDDIFGEKAQAELAAREVSPYGGKGPSVATGPQAQAELRNEIETRRRALAAQRAEAEPAKQAARARIEGANNQAEQAFLKRLEAQRQAAAAQRGVEADATWDFRTPAELAPVATVGNAPSGVTRMDRLRGIATLNAQTPEEYAYLKWLHSRAPFNQVSTAGGAPLRGIEAASRTPRFLNMGRIPSLGGLGVAGGAVSGVLAPIQIYEQIKSANSSDPIEANYGAVDPFALRGLMDLALDPTVGGMSWEAAKRSYEKKANDPRYIEKSPITSAVGQAARGNPAYLKAFANNLFYYGDSPYGWGLFADEQPRNLNEAR